jgi:hypothetical protein
VGVLTETKNKPDRTKEGEMTLAQLKQTKWWRSERRAGFTPHPVIVKMLLDTRAVIDVTELGGLRVAIGDSEHEESSVFYWHRSRAVVERFANELRRMQG